MADYVYVKDYSKNGQLGISKSVFESIVSTVTNKIGGVQTKKANSPFEYHKPVKCTITNNKVNIELQVVIHPGYNVEEICSSIQQEVADALTQMVEVVPFSIKIRVVGIE